MYSFISGTLIAAAILTVTPKKLDNASNLPTSVNEKGWKSLFDGK